MPTVISYWDWVIERGRGRWNKCGKCERNNPDSDCPICGGNYNYFKPYESALAEYEKMVGGEIRKWRRFHGLKEDEK